MSVMGAMVFPYSAIAQEGARNIPSAYGNLAAFGGGYAPVMGIRKPGRPRSEQRPEKRLPAIALTLQQNVNTLYDWVERQPRFEHISSPEKLDEHLKETGQERVGTSHVYRIRRGGVSG